MMNNKPVTEVPTVVSDTGTADVIPQKIDINVVLDFLRRNNLKGAEAALVKESGNSCIGNVAAQSNENADLQRTLNEYRSAEDPESFSWNYSKYLGFLDNTLDSYKHELSLLLYPVFIHMYMNMVYNGHTKEATEFFQKYYALQEDFYAEYLEKLKMVKKREHMETDPFLNTFRTNKYNIKMARETYMTLKRHLQDNKMTLILSILQEQLFVETYDGAPRNRQQTLATSGGLLGEARKDVNKAKVFFGLFKEPEINLPIEEEEETDEGDKPPKKKSRKKDTMSMKKSKNDPNAPNVTRIPLPELRDIDKLERVNMYKDSLKRTQLNPSSLPSICFYTFLNSYEGVSCASITDDSSVLAAGFENSKIIVWSLSVQKLMSMKTGEDLSDLDKESDDILERIMNESTASENKVLCGHSGPVYAVSFSPDRQFLLSSSEDGTVRLWSLLTWSNIVCYKGHNYPVYDVQFSPHGYYFASCGHDRLARLWSTDHYQPLRLFAGHLSDVDCVKFHHNSNYVATGSSDRCVRLYDILNGNCVRMMSGHKGAVLSLAFSPCGRYLASGSADKSVNVWDLSNGTLVAQLCEHTEAVVSLAFSREGSILASGGLDDRISLWDMALLSEERPPADVNMQQLHELVKLPLVSTFQTKASAPIFMHFSRRNLLLGCGAFRA